MFLDTEIRDSAYQFFTQEAIELLQTIEEGLIILHSDRSTANVHNVMRAAHSIKGGAASIELNGITNIAHKLEDAFRALYHEEVVLDVDLEELLFMAFDCLRTPLIQQIETGSYDEVEALKNSEPVFEALFGILGDPSLAEAEMPTSAELGVDIVQVVFESDVTDGIARLQNVLSDPDANQVSGELRAQAEVFMGLGELLNLSGFSSIALATIAALDAHPEYTTEIGWLTIADFQAAQASVLAGDRTSGGSPSDDLVELGQSNTASSASEVNFSEANFSDFQPEFETEAEFNPTSLADLNTMFGNDFSFDPESEPVEFEITNAAASLTEDSNDLVDLADDFSDDLANNFVDRLVVETEAEYTEDSLDISQFEPELALDFDRIESEDLHLNLPIELSDLDFDPDLEPELDTSSQLVPIDNLSLDRVEHPPLQVTDTTEIISKTASQTVDLNAPTQSIRVDLNRLERLNNLAGELVIQETSTSLQNQQLQSTLQTILKRFAKFEVLAEGLQNWADRNQNAGIKTQDAEIVPTAKLAAPLSQNSNSQNPAPTFDLLELDSYSNLYSLVQAAVEEMAQIGESVRDVTQINKQAELLTRKKQQTLKQVRDDLLWSRMLPLRDILNRFPRMVRDLSTQANKEVKFKMVGASTLIDKAILEKLYDPLVHLIRNAFDHGIESPQNRTLQGKPSIGTIEIRAYHRGNQTYIEVRDDGQGIDEEKVLRRATAMNLLPPADRTILSERQIYECLFAPGFTTAEQVSQISGRGMGLDTVQIQVKGLKGAIAVTSEQGKGTTFTIRLPLTLSIAKLLVFSINSRMLAIPIDSLLSINNIDREEIQTVQNQQFYPWEDELVPICPRSLLSYRSAPRFVDDADYDSLKTMTLDRSSKMILISHGDEVIALEVDRLIAEQEFAIKPFGKAIAPPPYLYGCTILGDGSLVPVVDGAALVTHWLQPEIQQKALSPDSNHPTAAELAAPITTTVLVVDDSLTMRQTLSLTLQKQGYRVFQARDGREALDLLQQNPSIQAVLCDIEMPRMNGFEFLTHYRTTFVDRNLPVIMLTTRGGEKHRQLATYLGAKAYLTKPFLEQELIQVLNEQLSIDSMSHKN